MSHTLQAILLNVHAFATLALVGLIWTIQVVHYPLFRLIPADDFSSYERAHMRRITLIVGPLMLIEAATAVWLVVMTPEGVPAWSVWVGLALVLAIWAMTATVQGPAHQRLAKRFDAKLHRLLVRSNWFRTIMWSARGVIALIMLGSYPNSGPMIAHAGGQIGHWP